VKRKLPIFREKKNTENMKTNIKNFDDNIYNHWKNPTLDYAHMFFIPKIYIFVIVAILSFNTHIIATELSLEAKSAILVEPTTKQVLYEHNPHEILPPASVTKIMTMLLIYESVANGKISWEDDVIISSHAANMGGSQIFLEEGQTQKVKELTKSIIIASANDAAVAMAEHIAGSEESFVILMNERAKLLGMENTNFENACGLDTAGHTTTAYDIALMTAELILNFPEISETALIWMDTITHKTRRGSQEFGLTNTNKLIKSYSGITGLKTGSTSSALFCISATAKKEDLNLISVILGAPSSKTRFNEAAKLLDHGFANFAIVKGEEQGTLKGYVGVHKGNVDQIELVVKNQVNALIPKGEDVVITHEIETLDFLNAPIKKDTKAGEIIYKNNGIEIARADLVVSQDVEKASFGHMIKRLFFNWN